MPIFELTLPGSMVEHPDPATLMQVASMLSLLETHFYDANLSLNLFEEARPHRTNSSTAKAQFLKDSEQRSIIRNRLEADLIANGAPIDHLKLVSDVELQFYREQIAFGRIPREFTHRKVFLYARAFLLALDGCDKCIGALGEIRGVPAGVALQKAEVAKAFPDLRGVRNTDQHLEDRFRGLGAGGKPLNPKPISTPMIQSPGGGNLAIGNLEGSKYGSTMADGAHGQVDVSAASMEALRKIVQTTIDAFKWKGPRRHLPTISFF